MKPLRKYQEQARYWCNRELNQGNNPLLVMPAGCISGDSIINLNRCKKGYKISIEKLYKRFNGLDNHPQLNYKKEFKTYVRSFNSKTIQLNEIEFVSYSGIKELYEVELENGLKIKATSDHKIMTKSGFKQLKKISENDFIMCDKLKSEKKENHEYTKHNDTFVCNLWFHPYAQKTFTVKDKRGYTLKIEKHRFIYEAHLNNLTHDEFKKILRIDKEKSLKLKFINPEKYHIHHKDFNHKNNSIENLEVLTISEHKKIHSEKQKFNFNQGLPCFSKVKSISYFGKDHTYDIGCYENHNFVANGIVIHNSGKTVTACNIITDRITLNKRLLVLCGTEEIFDQWCLECSHMNIDYGYINPEGVIGRNKHVYICMWQSLYNILNALPEKFCKSIKEIITDETHHSASPTLESIYEHFSHCLRIGLTATPYRMDNQPLGKYYNKMYEPIKQSEAIKSKFLCPPAIIVPDEYKNNVPDYNNIDNINLSEQRAIIKDKKIIGDMIGLYREVFQGALCMIPCSSIKHASLVAEMYRAEGWKVEHLSGTMNKMERKKIIRDARHGKINIITTYAVGTEGLDIPNIAGVIWMRFTQSLVVWIQMNTRAARRHGKKSHYILVDPVGNILIHGSPDIDRKWSLNTDYVPGQDISEAPTMRICPVCDTANSQANEKCWICGYDFLTALPVDKKRRKLPKFVSGELVWLEDKENEETGFIQHTENTIHNSNINSNSGDYNADNNVTSKAQKIELLKRDLTGLKNKTKFREGIKWL